MSRYTEPLSEVEQEELGLLDLEGEIMMLEDQFEEQEPEAVLLVLKNWHHLSSLPMYHEHFEGLIADAFAGRPCVRVETDDGLIGLEAITL
jgi:hypothetical protein